MFLTISDQLSTYTNVIHTYYRNLRKSPKQDWKRGLTNNIWEIQPLLTSSQWKFTGPIYILGIFVLHSENPVEKVLRKFTGPIDI